MRKCKRIVDKQRTKIHRQSHPHGFHELYETTEDGHAPTEEEEFVTLDCLELERVLSCDESNMDQKVFAQQRALNLQKSEIT